MNLYFNLKVAEECSTAAAVVFEYISFLAENNRQKKGNESDSFVTCISLSKIKEHYGFLSLSQIGTAVDKLLKAGYLKKINKSKNAPTVYVLTEKGVATRYESELHIC